MCVVGARGLWNIVGRIRASCRRQPRGQELANTHTGETSGGGRSARVVLLMGGAVRGEGGEAAAGPEEGTEFRA